MKHCENCFKPLPPESTSRRRFCCAVCRVEFNRAAARSEAAAAAIEAARSEARRTFCVIVLTTGYAVAFAHGDKTAVQYGGREKWLFNDLVSAYRRAYELAKYHDNSRLVPTLVYAPQLPAARAAAAATEAATLRSSSSRRHATKQQQRPPAPPAAEEEARYCCGYCGQTVFGVLPSVCDFCGNEAHWVKLA